MHIAKEDGTTEADNLNRALSALENKRGKTFLDKRLEIQATLDIPLIPEEYQISWSVFFDLNSARTNNGFGPNPLSYTEIHSFIILTGRILLPYEIQGIKTIDAVFMKVNADLTKATQASKRSQDTTKANPGKPTARRR